VLLGSKYTPDTRVSYDDLAVITNPGSAFEWRTEINEGPMSAEVQAFLTLLEPDLNSQSSLQPTVSTPGVLNRLLDSPNGEGREKCDRTGSGGGGSGSCSGGGDGGGGVCSSGS
jgi:hypothetical protein